jgi:ABC-type uncharacterized transport system substrate-binding protein
MKIFVKMLIFLFGCIFFLVNVAVLAADKGNFSTNPATNNGKKWRIGYYEGGEYISYQRNLLMTVKGLMELGWIETIEIPSQAGEQTKDLWNWLVADTKSEYIEFVEDAHYSANWNKELRKKTAAEIINRLNETKDIDLMIAAGTWAGKDLANDRHQTPTIVISTSNAVSAGIIKSVEDSGYDHIHARVDPFRYERQITIFYNIIGFQKLGVAYENTATGRAYAAMDKVEQVAEEYGFEIVSCYTIDDVPDIKVSEESVKKCFTELGDKVDAIYVTVQNGVNVKSIPGLVNLVNSFDLPTFSQYGSSFVKYGFLMSISRAGYKYVGHFYAETIAKIFNGAKPRQLDQLFEDPPKIAINLKTAEIIGYDPPVDVLGAADEIYQEIEQPE